MQLAICEDTASDAQRLATLLSEYAKERPSANLSTAFFSSGEQVLAYGERVDCYLLDILLEGLNGMDLARTLRRRDRDARILFLTTTPDYALSAFSVRATDYLLKPVSRTLLFRALDDAAAELALRQSRRSRQFSFRTRGGLHTTLVEDILYIEIVGHTPFFHLMSGVVRGSDLRVSFEESMAGLVELGCFLRPHRSFLVNAQHITTVTAQSLRLDSGALIPVARLRAAEVKAQYLDYLMERQPDD